MECDKYYLVLLNKSNKRSMGVRVRSTPICGLGVIFNSNGSYRYGSVSNFLGDIITTLRTKRVS